jgi:hypothetical protein
MGITVRITPEGGVRPSHSLVVGGNRAAYLKHELARLRWLIYLRGGGNDPVSAATLTSPWKLIAAASISHRLNPKGLKNKHSAQG